MTNIREEMRNYKKVIVMDTVSREVPGTNRKVRNMYDLLVNSQNEIERYKIWDGKMNDQGFVKIENATEELKNRLYGLLAKKINK